MRQSLRGWMAVLGGWVLAIGAAGGAMAAPSDAEAAAIYEVRAELIEALRETKTELARYNAYRDEPRWYVVDDGWGYVDVDRLADYVPIAQYVEEHPDSFAVLSAWPFGVYSSLVASVSLLTEEASSGADVPRAARRLAKRLSQSEAEKAPTLRPYLQMLREERELTITAIDTLDALIEGLGLNVPGPRADEVAARSGPPPDHGPGGAMAAFRQELLGDLAHIRGLIRDCRAWVDDPDTHINLDNDNVGFDLRRLADYESAVEFIRDHDWAWAILDAPAARGTDLAIATELYLETVQPVPRDLADITEAVIEANRQPRSKRRSYCAETLGTGKRYRDALAASLTLADEITEALGLDVEPTSPPAPTPQPPTPEPSLVPTPTPEPMPPSEPAESIPPNPFLDA